MIFRNELKYYINFVDSQFLSNAFNTVLQKDGNGINGMYNVRSLYFDDLLDNGIFEKQSGIFDRKKFRIRHYNNSHDFFKLECKTRVRDMVSKQATTISKDDVLDFQTSGLQKKIDNSKDDIYKLFCSNRNINQLSPAVIVEYMRSAWRHEGSDFRVTIDVDVSSHLSQTNLLDKRSIGVPMIDEGHHVLELKFLNDFPLFIKDILSSCDNQRYALSKYVICRKLTKFNKWEDQ